jgi:hypothetical protein
MAKRLAPREGLAKAVWVAWPIPFAVVKTGNGFCASALRIHG